MGFWCIGLAGNTNLMVSAGFVHARSVLPVWSGALLVGATGLLAAPSATSVEDPSCAVWVVRNALETRESWGDALASVERVGCDRIYLQVSGRWDAYFLSTVWPSPATPPHGAGWAQDPFGEAVSMAHARGVEVHAWINALLAWSAEEPPDASDHVFLRHPEWFVRDARGRSMRALDRAELDRSGLVGEGWFLDARREEVRSELRRFVLEVAVRYPVDGIHLDYIRYPTGWVPEDGADAVTLLVDLIRGDLRAVRPRAELSAAVMPRPDIARSSFGQDWRTWVARGLVDAVAPMVYRKSPEAVLRVVEAWPVEIPREKVWVGVRIDRLSPRETSETLDTLGKLGASGVALFSHNLLRDDPAWRRVGSSIVRGR